MWSRVVAGVQVRILVVLVCSLMSSLISRLLKAPSSPGGYSVSMISHPHSKLSQSTASSRLPIPLVLASRLRPNRTRKSKAKTWMATTHYPQSHTFNLESPVSNPVSPKSPLRNINPLPPRRPSHKPAPSYAPPCRRARAHARRHGTTTA